MTLEQQLLDKLDALIKIFTGDTNTSSSSGTTTQHVNSDLSGFNKKELDDYIKGISEIKRETNQIKKNIFDTETAQKRLNRLTQDAEDIKKKMDGLSEDSVEYKRQEYFYARKLNEIEKENKDLENEINKKLIVLANLKNAVENNQ